MYRLWQTWATQSLACLLAMQALAPGLAWAGPFGGQGEHQGREARREMVDAAKARREANRDARRERAEMVQEAGEQAGLQGREGREGRRGRLTPEERRALRRHINEAGQGIYPVPPKN